MTRGVRSGRREIHMNRPFLILTACLLPLVAACESEQSPPAVDKAQDAMAAPVGQMSASTVGQTVEGYVTAAAVADMYEIQAAEIALERSQTADIREMAEMIRTDHTQASANLKQVAPQAAPEAEIPTELDERRKGLIDNLRSAPQAEFDRTYRAQQVAAHEEALTLHRGFADNPEGGPLAEHARTVVPKIEMHLRMAQAGAQGAPSAN